MSNALNYVLDMVVLNAMIRDLDGNVTEAVVKAALLVEGHAKLHAPVDTGALRASISVSMKEISDMQPNMSEALGRRSEAKIVALPVPKDDHTAYVGPTVSYGEAVELGSTRRAGTPYLQPALRETEADIRGLLKTAISNGK